MATSKKMSSPLMEIPDHLLTEILLRLPAPADLARASAACVSIRRLVTEGSFLRCFRRRHAPPLLGFHDHEGFNPVLPPHPSAPAARELVLAADFSFSFLPSHCRWEVQDIRDGRVLLHRLREHHEQLPVFRELVVCDPLHRRYVLLPPVPHDLAASVPIVRRPQHQSLLVPLGEEEAAEETAFKVIYILHYKIKLHAFVFSSSTGQWRAAASKAWSDLLITSHEFDFMSRLRPFFLRHHYAYGCVYWDWLVINVRKLLVLDTTSMEFSMADLPPGDWSTLGLSIAEAGDGRLGMFGFRVGTASDLSYTIARNKGKSPSHWQMEKRISLDHGYVYDIKGATERYLLLRRTETSSDNPLNEYFSMDTDTLQLQSVSVKRYRLMYGTHIYTNFPPSLLSSPTI